MTIPFTLSVLLLFSGVLIVLPIGYIGWAIVIGIWGLMGIVGLHYFIWGWWLTKIVREEEDERSQGEDTSQT